jgi:hypothetical protein
MIRYLTYQWNSNEVFAAKLNRVTLFSRTEAYETQLNTLVLKLENANIHCEGRYE